MILTVTATQVLDDTQLQELIDGLDANNINHFSHIINGYIGSRSFLSKPASVVSHLKTINPDLVYVCDPVMGDTGPGLYVPADLLPVYREVRLSSRAQHRHVLMAQIFVTLCQTIILFLKQFKLSSQYWLKFIV